MAPVAVNLEARAPVSVAPEAHQLVLGSNICRLQCQYLSLLVGALLWLRYLLFAAPVVSVACRLQYLLLTAPVLVSGAHSSSTVDPLAPPGQSVTRSSSSFCSLLL